MQNAVVKIALIVKIETDGPVSPAGRRSTSWALKFVDHTMTASDNS
jgi:hypothetical protein